MEYVPVLATIAPVELCRREATLFLTCRTMKSSHLLYPEITAPEQEQSRRLKSRLLLCLLSKGLLAYLTHLKIKAADRADILGILNGAMIILDSTNLSLTSATLHWKFIFKTGLYSTKFSSNRCWALPLHHIQVEFSFHDNMQIWRGGSNGRRYKFQLLLPLPISKNRWSDQFR